LAGGAAGAATKALLSGLIPECKGDCQ
jgi:hypothetical protein